MVNRFKSVDFTITAEWIEEFKTFGGGWTKAQFHALGLPFCPGKGWKKRLVGEVITDEMRVGFEQGRDVYAQLDPTNPKHQHILKRIEANMNKPL